MASSLPIVSSGIKTEKTSTTVTGIEMFRKLLDEGTEMVIPGDNTAMTVALI